MAARHWAYRPDFPTVRKSADSVSMMGPYSMAVAAARVVVSGMARPGLNTIQTPAIGAQCTSQPLSASNDLTFALNFGSG